MKILIIKLSAFGDMIHALPALHDLLQRPEVGEVHWLMDARFAFVADLLPAEVTTHIVALKGKGGLGNGWAMAARLRQQKFDVVLDLQGLIKSGLMARAIGAPCYGFDGAQSPEWPNRWLVTPVAFHAEDRHVVQCYRRIAAAIFATPCSDAMAYHPPEVAVTTAMVEEADRLRCQWKLPKRFALCHIGGSYATKRLPEATWRAVLTKLGLQQPMMVLWGSADEQRYAQRVAFGIEGAVVAEKRLSITTLAGLLDSACGYIGPDSGVTHLAAAVGCPTVTLWGPTAPWRMGAIGEHNIDVISQTDCSPCFKRSCHRFVCMPSLSPQTICTAFECVIKKRVVA